MGALQTRLSDKQLLWQGYRDAFRHFEREANRLAEINGRPLYDAVEAERALLRLEQARLAYNDTRDTLAASMMPAEVRRKLWAIAPAPRYDGRVKDIAELFWELAGKPQGTALDDWYRAERVVKHAGVEACCAR